MSGPIFVVGSMGSGTTLMRLMLDSHPSIMIAEDAGFLRSVNAIRSIPYWNAGTNWIKRIGVTPQELDRSIEGFYDEVFRLAAAKRGATRWGDRTSFHVEFVEAAARVFPDAVFVGTVRHPGAVAHSLGRFGWSWKAGVRHWCTANEWLIEGGLSVGDRLRLWRYEDLATSPEAVMGEVLGFVGEPWDPRVLEHPRHQTGPGAEGAHAQDLVDADRIGSWRDGVTGSGMEVLLEMAGPLARFFGYDIERVLPVGPVGGSLPSGLGASAGSWPDRADEFWDLPRHITGHEFENSMYTQADLAVELGAAYRSGARGGRIRRPYRDMLPEDQGGSLPDEPASLQAGPATRVSRTRRRLARVVSPDH